MKTVFVSGCFDIIHPGHIRLFQFAKTLGDRLFIGINSDGSIRALKGPTRPIQPLNDRIAVLWGFEDVDAIESFDEPTPDKLISRIMPDFILVGEDHLGVIRTKPYANRVVVCPRSEHSTTMILDKIVRTYRRDG